MPVSEREEDESKGVGTGDREAVCLSDGFLSCFFERERLRVKWGHVWFFFFFLPSVWLKNKS